MADENTSVIKGGLGVYTPIETPNQQPSPSPVDNQPASTDQSTPEND